MFDRNRRRNRRRESIYTFEEARRMQHRQNVWKRIAPFLVGIVVVLIVVIIAFFIWHKKPFGNKLGFDTEQSEAIEEVVKEDATQDTNVSESEEVSEHTEQTESETLEEEPEPQVYKFETTPDTVTISNDEIISSHIILVDESTDTIIAQKGAMERISPASMTKVLTILVAAEHISEENLDDTFTITFDITNYSM